MRKSINSKKNQSKATRKYTWLITAELERTTIAV